MISLSLLAGMTVAIPGRVAQSVTCLATDACLTADPGVASSIPARYHTFVEIDHEIISTVILLLLLIYSRRVVVSYKRKYVHKLLVNRLLKPAQEKSVVKWTDRPAMTIAVDMGRKANKQTNKQTNKDSSYLFFIEMIVKLKRTLLTGDKNISILHSPCRTSDIQISLVLQTHALVLKNCIVCNKENGGGGGFDVFEVPYIIAIIIFTHCSQFHNCIP